MDEAQGEPEQIDVNQAIPMATASVNAPTVFADAVWFAANFGETVRIQFIENMLEPANSPSPGWKSRHVGTLVMPRIGFKNMMSYLNGMDAYFDQLEAQKSVEGNDAVS